MNSHSKTAPLGLPRVALVISATLYLGCDAIPTDPDAPHSSALVAGPAGVDNAVDDGYVLTPAGRLHRSCIHQIPFQGTADGKGNIAVDGRIVEHYENCRHQSFPTMARQSLPIPTVSGWVEYISANAFTNSYGFDWFNLLYAVTTVPAAPTTSAPQTVFFFPALQPTSGNTLLQPVIQWGPSLIGGGQFWTIAVWYLDASGNAFTSPLAAVSPGDTIVGGLTAVRNTCSGTGVCQWQMVMLRNGALAASAYVQTNETYRVASKAVLEAWNLTSCTQFPNQTSLVYSSVNVYMPGPLTTTYNEIAGSLSWSSFVNPHSFFPVCNYGTISPDPHVGVVEF